MSRIGVGGKNEKSSIELGLEGQEVLLRGSDVSVETLLLPGKGWGWAEKVFQAEVTAWAEAWRHETAWLV